MRRSLTALGATTQMAARAGKSRSNNDFDLTARSRVGRVRSMCGIAGVVGVDSERSRVAALRMQGVLFHRVPDDRGFELVPATNGLPVALVHTRLSIVELSSDGHQPMFEAQPE